MRLLDRLRRPIDGSALAMFRILFGTAMVLEAVRFVALGRIEHHYLEPTFHFTYPFFEFVKPWPGQGMHVHLAVMGASALGIALGLWYRLCAGVFFLTYTSLFLIDKTFYNNHYYLISLLAFLLTCVDAHRWASVDGCRRRDLRDDTHVPTWHLWILRAQIVLVYFYAGVAKLNADWLCGEPMRQWLAARTDVPILGPWLTREEVVFAFSYGGLLFDLCIGPLLLWRRTRLLAVVWVLAFHLINSQLFSIGIFPALGIATVVLFGDPDWPRRLLSRLGSQPPAPSSQLDRGETLTKSKRWAIGFVIVYLAVQVLVPLRHWLYPGDVAWTEEGHRFSWRMKLRDKEGTLTVRVTDPATGESRAMELTADLTAKQIDEMTGRPDMILQYVHFLKRRLQREGIAQPIITVESMVSLNGREPHPLIDPSVNLAEVHPRLFCTATWILSLRTPLARCWKNRSVP